MTSVRIDERLAATVDRAAAANGESRTAFHERALAREALRASGGRPSTGGDKPGDDE
jgi:predicted transcriptional regulator